MGSGLITITVSEATGPLAVSSDIDKLAIVAGWASGSGAGFSGLSSFFISGSSAQASVGYGDASDALCQIIEQRFPGNQTSAKFPAALYGMDQNGSEGVYGTIDTSGVTGSSTVTVDGTQKPYGTYRAAVRISDDGNEGGGTTVGSDGIKYQWRLGEDEAWSNAVPLGTDNFIEIPNSGVKFDLAAGDLKTDDTWFVRTLAPTPSTDDVDAMFLALMRSRYDFGILVLEFPMTADIAAHVTTGLNLLRDKAGKRPLVIARTRLPDWETSETDVDWNASVGAEFPQGTVDDSRIHLRATYNLITDAMTTREYLRSDLAQFAADTVRVDRSVYPGAPADQAVGVPNVRLTDDTDTLRGHDEGPRGDSTGLSNTTLGNRFGCQQRIPNPLTAEGVYNTFPWQLFAANEKIRNIMSRRIANALERDAVNAGQTQMGGKLFYTPADPADPGSVATLTEPSRNALHAAIYDALSSKYANDIQNADDASPDTGLVQVPGTVVVTDGNVLGATVILAPLMFGYLVHLTIVVNPKE